MKQAEQTNKFHPYEQNHFQRFGEGFRLKADKLDEKSFYALNSAFDKQCNKQKQSSDFRAAVSF